MGLDLFADVPSGIVLAESTVSERLSRFGVAVVFGDGELRIDEMDGWQSITLMCGPGSAAGGFDGEAEESDSGGAQLTVSVPFGPDGTALELSVWLLLWYLIVEFDGRVEDPQSGDEFGRGQIAAVEKRIRELISEVFPDQQK
jgi:hypothetical protein